MMKMEVEQSWWKRVPNTYLDPMNDGVEKT